MGKTKKNPMEKQRRCLTAEFVTGQRSVRAGGKRGPSPAYGAWARTFTMWGGVGRGENIHLRNLQGDDRGAWEEASEVEGTLKYELRGKHRGR